MIIQATKKLQDMIDIKTLEPLPESESFAHWHGNVFMIGRRKCLLLTHNQSLYSVFIYGITKQTFKCLAEIIKNHLSINLTQNKFSTKDIEHILSTIENISYTKTSNRSVIGSMNDMVNLIQHIVATKDELGANFRINNAPFKSIDYQFPSEKLLEILGSDFDNIIQF